MSRKLEGPVGGSGRQLEDELRHHLREIEQEEAPEKLLTLARKLQDLLRVQEADC